MWAGLNGFDPRKDLVLGGIRIGHGLHDSSYHYFKVYAGTRNLKHVKIGKFIIHQLVDKLTLEPLVACAPFVV